MRVYLIRRLLLIIPTLFILSILVFLSVRFIPGDAIDLIMDRMVNVAGARLTVKLLIACWDWTCPSTCSMDAGWEISSGTALLANHCGALRR